MASAVHTGDKTTPESKMDKHPCPPGARVPEQREEVSLASSQGSDCVVRAWGERWTMDSLRGLSQGTPHWEVAFESQ